MHYIRNSCTVFPTGMVSIPSQISEQEELALFHQDQKWLEEIKQEGVRLWQAYGVTYREKR